MDSEEPMMMTTTAMWEDDMEAEAWTTTAEPMLYEDAAWTPEEDWEEDMFYTMEMPEEEYYYSEDYSYDNSTMMDYSGDYSYSYDYSYSGEYSYSYDNSTMMDYS